MNFLTLVLFIFVNLVTCYVICNTSVLVPSKMMASKKKHLIFYCHFIYFTFILLPKKN